MVNNAELLKTLLSFTDKDDFYFVQIFKRRKDNPDLGKDQIVIDNFYIDSMEDFDKKVPYIINLCNLENARAYIRINKRNYAKLGPHFLKRAVDIVFTENCKALRNMFDSVAGEHHSDPDKKWIVDLDFMDNDEFKNEIVLYLKELQFEARREPMLILIPTKNGEHVITRPFNLQVFKSWHPEIDVHRDNPTLLYCP
jgi:hypothetical protein